MSGAFPRDSLEVAPRVNYPLGPRMNAAPTDLTRAWNRGTGAAPGLRRNAPRSTRVATTSGRGRHDPLQKRENRAVARVLKPSAGLVPATPFLIIAASCVICGN